VTSRWPSLWVFLVVACAAGADDAGLPTWAAELELVVGGAEEGPTSFSDIRAIDVDASGTMYVLEAKEQELRVFGPDGTFLRQVGRKGSGPGEFEQANGVALAPGGEIWVYSPAARRLEVFDTSGAVRASHHVPATSWGWLWTGGVDSAGRLYDSHGVRLGEAYVSYIIRTTLASGARDTLPWPDCPASSPGFFAFPRGSMTIPFAHAQLRVMDARGHVWCGDTGELALHQYRLGEAEPVRTLALPLMPALVSAAERDSAIAGVERFKERAGDATLDYSLIPAHKPIVDGVVMDDEGRVWVRTRTVEGIGLVVFDAAGTPLARVPLPVEPKAYAPFLVRGDRIYFVATDADDVPSVVRYRVVR
jgi:hypothetical protein